MPAPSIILNPPSLSALAGAAFTPAPFSTFPWEPQPPPPDDVLDYATVVGIHFGTTNTHAAVYSPAGDNAHTIYNSWGDAATPSCVAFTKFGETVMGKDAAAQAAANPERTICGIKHLIGRRWALVFARMRPLFCAKAALAHRGMACVLRSTSKV